MLLEYPPSWYCYSCSSCSWRMFNLYFMYKEEFSRRSYCCKM